MFSPTHIRTFMVALSDLYGAMGLELINICGLGPRVQVGARAYCLDHNLSFHSVVSHLTLWICLVGLWL